MTADSSGEQWGMSARAVPSIPTAIGALEQRGCGAWVDDHGCGGVPTRLVIGQTELHFATYVNAAHCGLTLAVLCARHHPANGPAGLTADMRPISCATSAVSCARPSSCKDAVLAGRTCWNLGSPDVPARDARLEEGWLATRSHRSRVG